MNYRDAQRPRLLDLFCGAGGAAVGYARAGFEVVGVDVNPQPRYPFGFVQADALEVLSDPGLAGVVDVIHASPPCQAYANLANMKNGHPDLLAPVLRRLEELGLPYVVENIADAVRKVPEFDGVRLCGSMFGLGVRRHRVFASGHELTVPPCDHKGQGVIRAYYGKPRRIAWAAPGWDNVQTSDRRPLYRGTVDQAPADMGIDWMTWDELREAIPPAYTEHIGRQLIGAL